MPCGLAASLSWKSSGSIGVNPRAVTLNAQGPGLPTKAEKSGPESPPELNGTFSVTRLGQSISSASKLTTSQEFARRFQADDLLGAQADELLGTLASDFQFVGHWSCGQLVLVYASRWSEAIPETAQQGSGLRPT